MNEWMKNEWLQCAVKKHKVLTGSVIVTTVLCNVLRCSVQFRTSLLLSLVLAKTSPVGAAVVPATTTWEAREAVFAEELSTNRFAHPLAKQKDYASRSRSFQRCITASFRGVEHQSLLLWSSILSAWRILWQWVEWSFNLLHGAMVYGSMFILAACLTASNITAQLSSGVNIGKQWFRRHFVVHERWQSADETGVWVAAGNGRHTHWNQGATILQYNTMKLILAIRLSDQTDQTRDNENTPDSSRLQVRSRPD